MNPPLARLMLKVLAGPQAGGEMLLSDGDYVAGSDESCDIWLLDELAAPRHALFAIRQGVVECRALDGAQVGIDGILTTGTRLAPFQCVIVGQTPLAIGPTDRPWPAWRPSDPPPSPAGVEADAVTAAPSASATAASTPSTLVGTAPTEKAITGARQPSTARSAWALLWLIPLALLGGGVWYVMHGDPPAAAPAYPRALQQAALEQAIAKLGWRDSVSVTDEGQRFVVAGHVAAPADKRALRAAVADVDPSARVRVHDAATLAETVQGVLRMHRVDLRAAAGRPGEIIVSGRLKDAAAWLALRERILNDMPHLASLTEDFANAPQATAAASATPAAPPVEAPHAAAEQPPPPPGLAEAPRLPPIQSVSVGNTQFLTLVSGEHVFPGAVLENGYTVTTIAADRVVLARNGRQHVIKIGI